MASSSEQIDVTDDNKKSSNGADSDDDTDFKRLYLSPEFLNSLLNEIENKERKMDRPSPSTPVEIESTDVLTTTSGQDTTKLTSDDKSCEVKTILKKSVEEIEKGYSCENSGNPKEALKLYKIGLQGLLFCKKYGPKSDFFQEELVKSCKTILSRAEQMKDMLKDEKKSEMGNDASAESNEDSNVKLPEFVITERSILKFDDVVGLQEPKDALKECVILPLKFPQLFTGRYRAHYGIMLYGAPGAGKTMLTRALGGELNDVTYITASVYDFMSKYSDGERQVKQLFSYANEHVPCVLILDDFEAISSNQEETQRERRVKTEFLVQFQDKSPQTMVIAVTLSPWTMCPAVRKRFSKRVHVPLPTNEDRKEMFRKFIQDSNLVPSPKIYEEDLELFAERTEGFTGADINVIVRDSMMVPVREIQNTKYFKKISVADDIGTDEMVEKFVACCHEDKAAMAMEWTSMEADQLYVRPLKQDDVLLSIGRSKPSISAEDLEKFAQFTNEFT